MKWNANAAIGPIPSHAVVPAHAITELEAQLSAEPDLDTRVDRAFSEFEERQPALAAFVLQTIEGLHDETAQTLGYFLGVAAFMAFQLAFADALRKVEQEELEAARATFEVDEELRKTQPGNALESDDIVAMGQPHIVGYIREQLDSSLEPDEEQAPTDVDLDAVAQAYRMVLIEVLALGSAVEPPRGTTLGTRKRLLA